MWFHSMMRQKVAFIDNLEGFFMSGMILSFTLKAYLVIMVLPQASAQANSRFNERGKH